MTGRIIIMALVLAGTLTGSASARSDPDEQKTSRSILGA